MIFEADQKILVTGASSGIGRAIAYECLKEGATVLACGRNAKKIGEAGALSPAPDRWIGIARDLAKDVDGLDAWVLELAGQHGKLSGFAHSAGTAIMDALRTYDAETGRNFFEVNFHAPLMLAKGFSNRRASEKNGAICFMASAAAVFPEKGHLLYGAAKAALVSAAKSMSQELAPRIRVNCISPGIVETPMQEAAEALMGAGYRERELAGYPLGFGQPEDVARMAVFLLSSRGAWITGQNFVLAGGRY